MLMAATAYTSPALAEVEARLAVDAGVFLSSNPFLVQGTDRSAVIGEVSVRPSVTLTSATGSSLEVTGVFTERRYSRRYGDFQLGKVDAAGTYRDDERLSVLMSAGFERGILADEVTSGIDAATDGRGLHEDYYARAGLTWRPDAYFQVQPELSLESTHYPGPTALRDTRVATARLGVSRRTSPYTRVGGRMEIARNSADGQSNFTTVSGYVTLEHRVREHLRATVELGAERNGARELRFPGAAPVREAARTRFSGRAELCHERHLLTICAEATLDSEVSGLAGLQRRMAASLSATRRLSRSVTLAVAGEYQHASVEGANLPALDSMRADARVEWQLNRRLSVAGTIEYRRRELFTGDTVDAGFLGIRLRYDWRRL